MAQLPLPDILATFLSRCDKKSLRCVSRAIVDDPRSLQEQLLAMTRRANRTQDRLVKMEADRDYIQGSLEYVREHHDYSIRKVSRLQTLIETLRGIVRDFDPDNPLVNLFS